MVIKYILSYKQLLIIFKVTNTYKEGVFMRNPYSLVFGKEPMVIIDRSMQTDEIVESFDAENPDYQVCMITGVRGSGKTVFMTSVANMLASRPDWVVVNLSVDRDLLLAMAAKLSDYKGLEKILDNAKINLSVFGFGVEVSNDNKIIDIGNELSKILAKLTQHNKKILVTIDEVVANKYMVEFASMFQIYMREKYNVFLLMTGLYENIYELQNKKSLTFLYRAPRLQLEPLSISMITYSYKEIFNLPDDRAVAMARFTEGYPFAFQVLGYLCFKKQCMLEEAIPEFDAYLGSYVYEKIWSELSPTDKLVVKAVATSHSTKVEDIRNIINMPSNKFSTYRLRLLKKGILKSSEYGNLKFTLPRFKEFVLNILMD